MSIRLLLDGHNFSHALQTIEKQRLQSENRVNVVSFDTGKTLLLPAYLCEKGVEGDYLRFNGMELTARENAVVSEPSDGIVALMGVDARVLEVVEKELGSEVRFTSPLLEIASAGRRNVNIFVTQQNTYLVVWEKGLKMAEVLPDTSFDSLLYYMQVLGQRFKLKRFEINIGGSGAVETVSELSHYFSNVRMMQQ